MSRSVEMRASAPGKLYLFGEYAVLAGAWSIVAAVDRRVTAERYNSATDYVARGLSEADVGFVRAVLEATERATGRTFDPGRFATDVTPMYDRGTKLGLGSSAASSVALAAVAAGGDEETVDSGNFRSRVLTIAERAHAAFQGGIGSGGGLVAASFGDILACRRRSPTSEFSELSRELELDAPETTEHFEFDDVRLPDDIEIRAIWLGEPASTAGLVRQVVRELRLHPAAVYRRLRRIGRVGEEAIRASGEEDAGGFVDCIRRADRAMEALGETCDVPVIVDRHRHLREVADRHGIAVKPSGAGGGDFSLAVGEGEVEWDPFLAELPGGAHPIELRFGASGVRREARE